MVNKERSSKGLNTLIINEKLATAAQWKADDMIEKDYFPEEAVIVAIHTGGLQGIEGFNQLKLKNLGLHNRFQWSFRVKQTTNRENVQLLKVVQWNT